MLALSSTMQFFNTLTISINVYAVVFIKYETYLILVVLVACYKLIWLVKRLLILCTTYKNKMLTELFGYYVESEYKRNTLVFFAEKIIFQTF